MRDSYNVIMDVLHTNSHNLLQSPLTSFKDECNVWTIKILSHINYFIVRKLVIAFIFHCKMIITLNQKLHLTWSAIGCNWHIAQKINGQINSEIFIYVIFYVSFEFEKFVRNTQTQYIMKSYWKNISYVYVNRLQKRYKNKNF